MPWTRDDADHLLRRAGFGGSLDDVDRFFALGQAGAIDALVNYESTPDLSWENSTPLGPIVTEIDARSNLVYQMYLSSSVRPLQTKMMWFWHSHFTTTIRSAGTRLMLPQLAMYRANALGDFETFISAVYKDAAMLVYLNGNGSSFFGPNENFARECMELFTIGTGTYTEKDVREAARALTGWYVAFNPGLQVLFDKNQHDNQPKTFLGQTGNFNGEDFVAMLAARPETPRRITAKLYTSFVCEQLNLVEQANLIQTWTSSQSNLRTVVNTLLNAPSFWDPANRFTLLKQPVDYSFGLLKRFEVPLNMALMTDCVTRMARMGHWLFEPNVSGYRPPAQLTGASLLLARYQFASAVLYHWSSDATIAKFCSGLTTPVAPSELINQIASRMGSMPLNGNTQLVIQSAFGTAPIADVDLIKRTRDYAFLIATTAEYQLL